MDTSQLLINILLYVMLPLWGVAGFADWCCHRATKIESTSGLKETILHSIMGLQIAIPILLCLLYQVNVLILIICMITWVLHELGGRTGTFTTLLPDGKSLFGKCMLTVIWRHCPSIC